MTDESRRRINLAKRLRDSASELSVTEIEALISILIAVGTAAEREIRYLRTEDPMMEIAIKDYRRMAATWEEKK